VTGANVLVAIFGEKDSHAVYFLHQQGVTRLDVVNYISHASPRHRPPRRRRRRRSEQETAGDEQQSGGALETYTLNLNAQALVGKIDPLIGPSARSSASSRRCAGGAEQSSPCGEAGVGKTAIAEGLARRIVEGQVPEILARCQVYMLDMGALLAEPNIAAISNSV